MRRALLLVAILAVSVLIALVVAEWRVVVVHASQETGTSNSVSRAYDYWSGFGSVIPWSLAIVGGIAAGLRHVNCHERGCWRLGVHSTPEGHKLCRKHVGMPKARLHLHHVHDDHRHHR